MGQAALESGWLDQAPGNNPFGIKSHAGSHGRQLLNTTEWFTAAELSRFLALGDKRTAVLKNPNAAPKKGRREYAVQDWFATFASLADAFAVRARMFSQGRYESIAARYQVDRDLKACIEAFAPIYATGPDYASVLLSIIYDQQVQAALAAARASE